MDLKSNLIRSYFLLALFLLLLNDFVLKSYFHNAFTGKLSDVSGLFAFSYFFSAFFSKEYLKKIVYVATAIFFTFWKSDYSTAFIDFMNKGIFHFGRVVDYSDLWALFILPISYRYQKQKIKTIKKINYGFKYAIFGISCFAFLATSSVPKTVNLHLHSTKSYQTNFSKETLIQKWQLNKLNDSVYTTFLSEARHHSTIDIKLIIKKYKRQQTKVKLDSILSFTHRNRSILSIFDNSESEINYMKNLTIQDYEKLFEKQKMSLLKP